MFRPSFGGFSTTPLVFHHLRGNVRAACRPISVCAIRGPEAHDDLDLVPVSQKRRAWLDLV